MPLLPMGIVKLVERDRAHRLGGIEIGHTGLASCATDASFRRCEARVKT